MSLRSPAFVSGLILLASIAFASPPKKHFDEPALDPVNLPDLVYGVAEAAGTDEAARASVRATQLACDPMVIRSFMQAWQATLDGTRNQGLAEAGFAIHGYKSTISIYGWRDVDVNHILIPVDGDTVAIAHVHGVGLDEHPSIPDTRSSIPNFVISQRALYVTVPGTTRTVRVRGGILDTDGWNKPCSGGSRRLIARR